MTTGRRKRRLTSNPWEPLPTTRYWTVQSLMNSTVRMWDRLWVLLLTSSPVSKSNFFKSQAKKLKYVNWGCILRVTSKIDEVTFDSKIANRPSTAVRTNSQRSLLGIKIPHLCFSQKRRKTYLDPPRFTAGDQFILKYCQTMNDTAMRPNKLTVL